MNLEVGDIVELIDDKGELKIISLISVNEILVEDEFGLQYKLDAEKVLKKTDSTIEFKVKEAEIAFLGVEVYSTFACSLDCIATVWVYAIFMKQSLKYSFDFFFLIVFY